ncbi:MAG: hypothetical protein ACK4SZ_13825 [Allosphingosinicella sp.]|uniref:hypothetical protein n=1 Tax=Allosphingosinicella sp. TaxID=2823234 RepID=UPI0039491700
MNLDQALADLEAAAFAAAIEEFNSEQAAGRLGLDAYQRGKRLNQDLTELGAAIAATMDEALNSL